MKNPMTVGWHEIVDDEEEMKRRDHAGLIERFLDERPTCVLDPTLVMAAEGIAANLTQSWMAAQEGRCGETLDYLRRCHVRFEEIEAGLKKQGVPDTDVRYTMLNIGDASCFAMFKAIEEMVALNPERANRENGKPRDQRRCLCPDCIAALGAENDKGSSKPEN